MEVVEVVVTLVGARVRSRWSEQSWKELGRAWSDMSFSSRSNL